MHVYLIIMQMTFLFQTEPTSLSKNHKVFSCLFIEKIIHSIKFELTVYLMFGSRCWLSFH